MSTSIGCAVYDRVPDTAVYPYIHISDIRTDDTATATDVIYTCEVLFDVVTNYDGNFGGRKDADAISQLVINYLSDNRGNIGDFYVVRCRPLSLNYLDEATDTGLIVRKLIRIEIIVEQI